MRARSGWGPVAVLQVLGILVVIGVVGFIAVRYWGTSYGRDTEPAPSWAPPVEAAAPTPAQSSTAQPDVTKLVDAGWASRAAAATGIPDRAVLAYAGASLLKASNDPACRLSWTTIAAIGRAESDNGSHGGSSIGADGTVSPPIYGAALNGKGVALIPDSDGGAIDGDATADRAVGPMQLIPQTWRNWHADGNGDGIEDPQNIDDASVATANYLCRASSGLDTAAGWQAAIRAYNSADSYLTRVASYAVQYNSELATVAR